MAPYEEWASTGSRVLRQRIFFLFGSLLAVGGALAAMGCSLMLEFEGGRMCGDGILDPGENCDGEVFPDGMGCWEFGFDSGELLCTPGCQVDSSGCYTCGDGECQDAESESSCPQDCEPRCGNGVMEGEESCDGTDLGGATCESLGRYGGDLACFSECTFDFSGCGGFCGDGELQQEQGEDCDGTNRTPCDQLLGNGNLGMAPCEDCKWNEDYCYQCGDGECNAEGGEAPACPEDCGWTQVVTGEYHSCGIRMDGTLFCWGSNSEGQLGQPSDTPSLTHNTRVELPGPVLDVATHKNHVCALVEISSSDTSVYCWGSNVSGQLGDGSFTDSATPVAVGGDLTAETVAQVVVGAQHTCALTESGEIYCWGVNEQGQLGIGQTGTSHSPDPLMVDPLPGGPTPIWLSAGANHTCALSNTQYVYCWGWDNRHQLGEVTTDWSATPLEVDYLSDNGYTVQHLSANNESTCVSTDNSWLLCWGANDTCQLGTGSQTGDQMPGLPDNYLETPVDILSVGFRHTCISRGTFEETYCFGKNDNGQLGREVNSTDCATDLAIGGFEGVHVTQLAAGGEHTCALVKDATDLDFGSIYCWGLNDHGQLGDGTNDQNYYPHTIDDDPTDDPL